LQADFVTGTEQVIAFCVDREAITGLFSSLNFGDARKAWFYF